MVLEIELNEQECLPFFIDFYLGITDTDSRHPRFSLTVTFLGITETLVTSPAECVRPCFIRIVSAVSCIPESDCGCLLILFSRICLLFLFSIFQRSKLLIAIYLPGTVRHTCETGYIRRWRVDVSCIHTRIRLPIIIHPFVTVFSFCLSSFFFFCD